MEAKHLVDFYFTCRKKYLSFSIYVTCFPCIRSNLEVYLQGKQQAYSSNQHHIPKIYEEDQENKHSIP